MKKNICVVMGGISTEREVSLNTGKEIVDNINKEKYNVHSLVINKKKDIFKLLDMDIDFVYIALHGKYGEDGLVQATLETMDIPYSGPGVMSSAICMDKDISKRIISLAGVRTAKWLHYTKENIGNWEEISTYLGNDVVVKPIHGGSSIGVHFVNNEQEYMEAISDIFNIDNEIIIEEKINGTEISIPIIDGIVYPTLKIEALAGEYFDYISKYQKDGAREYVKVYEDNLQKEINEMTKTAYEALKCKGFARVDMLLTNDDIPYFMEINTLPGMTAGSLLPKSLQYLGYDYTQTLDILIDASINIER